MTRPLGFPVTYQGLQELERRGISAEVIDTIMAYAVERRAQAIAPRYATYYDPWFWGSPWSWRWGVGFGYRRHRCR